MDKDLDRPSLVGLLLWQILAAALLMGIWVWVVPGILKMPAEVAGRIWLAPVYFLPFLLVFLGGSYHWFKPVVIDSRLFLEGKLSDKRLSSLLYRAYRYPYHAFLIEFVGVLSTGVALGLLALFLYRIDVYLVIELVLLLVALGSAFAMFSFVIGRLTTSTLLLVAPFYASGSALELGPQKRIVLGMVCVVLVGWIFLSVMLYDNHVNLISRYFSLPYFQPQLVGAAVFFVWFGPIAVLGSGVLSSYMARDLSVDIEAVSAGLQDLTDQELQPSLYLPVLSPDELGDLTSVFNLLVAKIVKLDGDMTDHAEMAGRASARQVEFFNVISHDLRTPLHSIVGFSQLLLEDFDGCLHAEKIQDVNNILSSAYHLLSLVDDLVDFSRMDSGSVVLAPTRVEIEQVIKQAMQAASGLIRGRNVKLQCELQPKLPLVYVDEIRMRQILFNLIGNALKFTRDGTVLVRAAEGSSGWLRVMVEDSGPGIPEMEMERIFEEFEQISIADSTMDRGSGLGLAITKRLVEMHGGEIRVSNRASGGTVFSINLPVAEGV